MNRPALRKIAPYGGGAPAIARSTLLVVASDETTAITSGNGKVTFRMPYAMALTAVKASLTTAQASGALFTVDIKKNGTTVLSTLLTFDNGETTTLTAATPAVISDASLAADDVIRVDVTQIGTSGATGLKVTLIGNASIL